MKFQAFYLSWKNISHNLVTVNKVEQSTGACHATAAAIKVQQVLQLPWGFNLLLVVNGDMQKHQDHTRRNPSRGSWRLVVTSTDPHFPPTGMTKIRT